VVSFLGKADLRAYTRYPVNQLIARLRIEAAVHLLIRTKIRAFRIPVVTPRADGVGRRFPLGRRWVPCKVLCDPDFSEVCGGKMLCGPDSGELSDL